MGCRESALLCQDQHLNNMVPWLPGHSHLIEVSSSISKMTPAYEAGFLEFRNLMMQMESSAGAGC